MRLPARICEHPIESAVGALLLLTLLAGGILPGPAAPISTTVAHTQP